MTLTARLSRVTHLVLEGGGAAGVGHLAALEALDAARSRLQMVAGTSAGALTALAVALGHSGREVREIVEGTPWEDWLPPRWAVPLHAWRLARRGGIALQVYPRRWIEGLIRERGLSPTTTFGGLEAVGAGPALHVVTTNVDRLREHVWSARHTPLAPVADAVLASMSIPVLYPPVTLAGDRHLDGGLTYNFPVDLVGDIPPDRLLAVRVDSPEEISGAPPRRWQGGTIRLLVRLFGIAMKAANRAHVPEELWPRVVRIPVDLSVTDFGRTREAIPGALDAGAVALRMWAEELNEEAA